MVGKETSPGKVSPPLPQAFPGPVLGEVPSPQPRSQWELSQSCDMEMCQGRLEIRERNRAGGWLHSQAGTFQGRGGPP